MASGSDKTAAIVDELRKLVKETKAIHFEGNGYSEEWKQEAKRRGLDCETSVPVIYDNYLKPESVAMFESTNVMTRKELAARNEVKWVTYTKEDSDRKSRAWRSCHEPYCAGCYEVSDTAC